MYGNRMQKEIIDLFNVTSRAISAATLGVLAAKIIDMHGATDVVDKPIGVPIKEICTNDSIAVRISPKP